MGEQFEKLIARYMALLNKNNIIADIQEALMKRRTGGFQIDKLQQFQAFWN